MGRDGFIRKPWIIIVLALMLIIPIQLTIWSDLGEWEGKLFPVVKDTQLTARERTQGGFLIQWHFDKTRSCTDAKVTVYSGERNSEGFRVAPFSVISVPDKPDFIDDSQGARPLGWQYSKVWLVWTDVPPITESVVDGKLIQQKNWFVDVTHDCHPGWRTRTRFWN